MDSTCPSYMQTLARLLCRYAGPIYVDSVSPRPGSKYLSILFTRRAQLTASQKRTRCVGRTIRPILNGAFFSPIAQSPSLAAKSSLDMP